MKNSNEKTYLDREIDSKFGEVHDRFDVQDKALEKILIQTTATNGKVKKIILAIAMIVGVGLGISGKEVLPILLKFII